jgi:hypothetical protein
MEIEKQDEKNFTVATSTPVTYNVDQLLAQKRDLEGRIALVEALLKAAADQGLEVGEELKK